MVDFSDGVWIVTLTGEHGMVEVEELQVTIRWLIAPHTRRAGAAVVVVDLTRVAFFDSSVAAAIMEAHDATQGLPDLHLALVVESADCFAARLLRVLGLTDLVPTFTDRAAVLSAVAELRESAYGRTRDGQRTAHSRAGSG
jgi:anti-anti-sigma regulatory factor